MDEREREPYPREDPREGAASDQNTELNPSDTAPREEDADDAGEPGGAPDTSAGEEGGPEQATGNPDAAG